MQKANGWNAQDAWFKMQVSLREEKRRHSCVESVCSFIINIVCADIWDYLMAERVRPARMIIRANHQAHQP